MTIFKTFIKNKGVMMKNILSILCFIIICLFINSVCTAQTKENDEIFPLAVGNEWTYAVYSTDGNNYTITKLKIMVVL